MASPFEGAYRAQSERAQMEQQESQFARSQIQSAFSQASQVGLAQAQLNQRQTEFEAGAGQREEQLRAAMLENAYREKELREADERIGAKTKEMQLRTLMAQTQLAEAETQARIRQLQASQAEQKGQRENVEALGEVQQGPGGKYFGFDITPDARKLIPRELGEDDPRVQRLMQRQKEESARSTASTEAMQALAEQRRSRAGTSQGLEQMSDRVLADLVEMDVSDDLTQAAQGELMRRLQKGKKGEQGTSPVMDAIVSWFGGPGNDRLFNRAANALGLPGPKVRSDMMGWLEQQRAKHPGLDEQAAIQFYVNSLLEQKAKATTR